jgi:hypothetical protein
MKYVLGLVLATFLGGCAIAPAGDYPYRDYNDGYNHRFGYDGEQGNPGYFAGITPATEVSQLRVAPRQ